MLIYVSRGIVFHCYKGLEMPSYSCKAYCWKKKKKPHMLLTFSPCVIWTNVSGKFKGKKINRRAKTHGPFWQLFAGQHTASLTGHVKPQVGWPHCHFSTVRRFLHAVRPATPDDWTVRWASIRNTTLFALDLVCPLSIPFHHKHRHCSYLQFHTFVARSVLLLFVTKQICKISKI